MAYTVFPQKTAEILPVVKSDAVKGGEIIELFTLLKRKYKTVKTPINIDPGKLSLVNVTRELQGTADLNTIKKEAKLSKSEQGLATEIATLLKSWGHNKLGQDLKAEYLPSMGTFPMEKYQKKISEGFIVDSLYNSEDKIFAGDSETSNEILSNFGTIKPRSHYLNKTVQRVGKEKLAEMFDTSDGSDDDPAASLDAKEEYQANEADFLNDNDQLDPTIQKYYKLLAKSSFFFLNTSTLLPITISLI